MQTLKTYKSIFFFLSLLGNVEKAVKLRINKIL